MKVERQLSHQKKVLVDVYHSLLFEKAVFEYWIITVVYRF